MPSMGGRIYMLTAQMAELLIDCHCTLEREDKSSENSTNPFSNCRHKTEPTKYRR